MTKVGKPKLSFAICTVKGYHSSNLAAVCAFFVLMSAIALLIVGVEARKVLSDENLILCLALLGTVLVLSASVFTGGLIITAVIKKKDCVIFFKDFIIVYEFSSLFNCGYRKLDYDEIAEYGFIHELDKEAIKLRMYHDSEVFNYGKLIIKDAAGKKYTVPLNDIDKVNEFLKEYTQKDETVYQRLKGIHY